MRINEFKVGILVMIEFDSGPAFIVVTLTAFDAAVTFVNIIQIVAKIAVFWRILVTLIDMTILAPHVLMIVPEGKIRFVVIKKGRQPRLFHMAVVATFTHSPLMRIIALMAINTFVLG